MVLNVYYMKKYVLVCAAGLLTTAAVTATMISTKEPKKGEVKESKKVEKKKQCSRTCFWS